MQNYFLRVIPTLKHYSTGNIGFDIPSGSIYGIFVLTFYLTFLSIIYFDILSDIIWHSIWHLFSHTFRTYVLTFLLAFYLASDILSGAWLRFGSAHWDLELTVETLTWQVEKIIPESNCSKIRTGWLGSSLQLALGLGKTLCLHVFASWIPALDVWSSICDGLSLVESNIFFVHYPIVWLNLQLQTPIFLKL